MTKRNLLVVFFILTLNFVQAQQNPYFTSIIDSDEHTQFGIATVSLNGGNSLIGGTRRHPFSNRTGLTFIRANAMGEKLSENDITFFNRNLYTTSMYKQAENTIITLAYVFDPQTNDANWMLFNTDTLATIRWAKEYGQLNRGESMNTLIPHTDGGFMVYGFISDSSGIGNNEYLVRLGSNGNMLWAKEYFSGLNTVGMGIVSAEEGSFILSADKEVPGKFYNVRLKKVDSTGNILWEKDLYSEYNGGCKSIIRSSSGDYIVVGESASPGDAVFDIYLIKINTDGDILKKVYRGTRGNTEAGFSIYEYTPNEFIIAGYSDSKADAKKYAMIMRIDSGLNETGRKYYGDSLINFFNHIRPYSPSSFLAVGNTSQHFDHFFLVHDGYDQVNGIQSSVKENFSIQIFPNPLSSGQAIHIQSKSIQKVHYQILTIFGELLEEGEERLPGSVFPRQILSKGMYLLKIQTNQSLSNHKILIE